MAKNVRALTDDEVKYFNDTYKFDVFETADGKKLISVTCNNYNRTITHPADRNFDISTKVRKVTISKDAIDLWINRFKADGYSLIDVQNAINVLIVTYRPNVDTEIVKQLKRGSSMITVE